ncbi:MAG: hypothetical protein IKG76_01520, partial [Firmicutes bacterium]|nr:hypothetical protein [Bacillota bacterium]
KEIDLISGRCKAFRFLRFFEYSYDGFLFAAPRESGVSAVSFACRFESGPLRQAHPKRIPPRNRKQRRFSHRQLKEIR